uniref:Uncharacterized protein n=1 Tax=Glossina morsitans morsitans TaxID=37546 RepID=A0ABK9NG36_GLOMM
MFIFSRMHRNLLLCSFIEEGHNDRRDAEERNTMRRARKALRDASDASGTSKGMLLVAKSKMH